MDAYDRCTKLEKKNLAGVVAIYSRGRKLFRPPMYVFLCLAQYVELWTVNRQLFANIHVSKTACAQHQIQLNDS